MRTRGTILIVFVLLIVAAFFAWKMFNPGPTAFVQGSTVALADYHAGDPTGVPADLTNADVVRRGEYLARAADCRACHTVSRDRLYAGGLPLLLPFGTLYSTNITADKETGIGNYSDQDFLNAVQRAKRHSRAGHLCAKRSSRCIARPAGQARAAGVEFAEGGKCDDRGGRQTRVRRRVRALS